MSTRSLFLVEQPKESKTKLKGIFCHWDGYPSHNGKAIWDLISEIRSYTDVKGTQEAINFLIDRFILDHKGGYSVFPTKCNCHYPCLAGTGRGDTNSRYLTDKDIKDSWAEYVYTFKKDTTNFKIAVVSGGEIKPIATIDLNKEQPDWDKLNQLR